ncbi:E3 SUMO-protein ligase ZBED1-like [Ruditapes philippinarum]|uniref:E3 SUMO-protein ligase ZBED1-like n=1 Tax=Ruditapes philippinarum TaxID=129788 RepID=UPI00295BFB08|nr:E3 SUMO-protein ligase ZBED1-like [Ruditapes philippinarum]
MTRIKARLLRIPTATRAPKAEHISNDVNKPNINNSYKICDSDYWDKVPQLQVSNDSVTVSTSRYTSSNISMKSDFPSLPSLPSMQLSDQKDQVTVQITLQQLEQTTVPSLFNKHKPFSLNSSQATTISQGIAEYIVTDLKPLTTAEGEGFRNLVKLLKPRYNIVSRNHLLEKYIVPMYHNTVDQVKRDLEKGMRHAFTTDGWTSINAESYITTTCHYIDITTFQLCSKALDTKCVHISHTSENLAQEMKVCINKWNLQDPVGVTDNAANIVNACNIAELPHVGCFGHTLNLAVNRCLAVNEVSALIGKCKKLVSVFKQSCLKASALHEAQISLDLKQLQVIQDVDTIWNSALAMIKRLLETMPAIWTALYKDKKYSHLLPSDIDRKNMEDLKDLLSPVEEATIRVSAEKSATASLILPMMESVVQSPESVQSENPNADVIDVKDENLNLVKKPKLDASDDDFFDVLLIKEEKSSESNQSVMKAEIERYKTETVSMKQDPIEWWKIKREIYLNLSTCACKYLHIPATSVPSERVFSTAGNILNKKRGQLTADNVDMLLFLYHNYKKVMLLQ